MSINLDSYPHFKDDLQGRDTNLFPMIAIGTYPETPILISTNSSYGGSHQFKPILLNVPSLKESIDIEKRNYKISSINIDISNYEYEGKRFSEIVSDHTEISHSLINVECRIYWISQSCRDWQYSFNISTEISENAALPIYYGNIRRYDHDDEKVRLVVEDRSQATLHRDLPGDILDANDPAVPDKYKNKPIPMVYGHVDKSPCVIKTTPIVDEEWGIAEGHIDIYFDTLASGSLSGVTHRWIFYDDKYVNIPHTILNIYDETNSGLPKAFHYDTVESSTIMELDMDVWRLVSKSSNPISFNILPTREHMKFDDLIIKPLREVTHDIDSQVIGLEAQLTDNIYYTSVYKKSTREIMGTFVKDNSGNVPSWDGTSQLFSLEGTDQDIFPGVTTTAYVDRAIVGASVQTGVSTGDFLAEIGIINIDADVYYGNISYQDGTHDFRFFLRSGEKLLEAPGNFIFSDTGAGWHHVSSPPSTFTFISNPEDDPSDSTLHFPSLGKFNLGCYTFIHNGGVIGALKIKVNDLNMVKYGLLENVLAKDYYADVDGRLPSPRSWEIINNILENELNYTNVDVADDLTYEWQYAFTIDKKINSKKLIEGLASASPYIPRFNNMGEFKFDVIKETYDAVTHVDGNPIPNSTILEDDVIDFSFSRTEIEDVKTKVEFQYKWDYARKEFLESYTAEADFWNNGYVFDYYGLKNDHSESTLVIDDDRGKYIRDYQTAKDFTRWMLAWSINQHLIMKVKLPLKYMNLEIGDIIEFDSILGGVKPYGINYRDTDYLVSETEGQIRQPLYPYFMITKTNKTLEYCEISAMQMHYLGAEVPGCMDDLACNHNLEATYQPNNACLTEDCAGVCGGLAVIDDCNNCGGSVFNPGDDCGACDDSIMDECGVCGGSGIPEGACNCAGNVLDCDNVCGGNATTDNCDECGVPDSSVCCTNNAFDNFHDHCKCDTVPTSCHNEAIRTSWCFSENCESQLYTNCAGSYTAWDVADVEFALELYGFGDWNPGETKFAHGEFNGIFYELLIFSGKPADHIYGENELSYQHFLQWATDYITFHGSIPMLGLDITMSDIIVVHSDCYYPDEDPADYTVISSEILMRVEGTTNAADNLGYWKMQTRKFYNSSEPHKEIWYQAYVGNEYVDSPYVSGHEQQGIAEPMQGATEGFWERDGEPAGNTRNVLMFDGWRFIIKRPEDVTITGVTVQLFNNTPDLYTFENLQDGTDPPPGNWSVGSFAGVQMATGSFNVDTASASFEHDFLIPFDTGLNSSEGSHYCSTVTVDHGRMELLRLTDAGVAKLIEDEELLLNFQIKIYYTSELLPPGHGFIYANHQDLVINWEVRRDSCTYRGDVNGDGGFNVLDIVTLADCSISQNCDTLEFGCAADVNGDGNVNVLDLVALANCILAQNCAEAYENG